MLEHFRNVRLDINCTPSVVGFWACYLPIPTATAYVNHVVLEINIFNEQPVQSPARIPDSAASVKIEKQYGRAKRVWVMDRGIPTEEQLQEMREASSRVAYLVGTPRGRLNKLEKQFLERPWAKVKEAVEVKLLPRESELYILAHSEGRRQKERAIRRRRLKRLWERLGELQDQELERDDLLLKLGAAKAEAGRVYRLVEIGVPKPEQPVTETFTFRLRKDRL